MPQDVRDLAAFYESPLGQLARRAILREIQRLWPDVRNYRLLGYGFALPYMTAFRGMERAIAAMPAPLGVIAWPDDKNAAFFLDDQAVRRVLRAAFGEVARDEAVQPGHAVLAA